MTIAMILVSLTQAFLSRMQPCTGCSQNAPWNAAQGAAWIILPPTPLCNSMAAPDRLVVSDRTVTVTLKNPVQRFQESKAGTRKSRGNQPRLKEETTETT